MGDKNTAEYIDDGDSLVSSVPTLLTEDFMIQLQRLNYIQPNLIRKSNITYKIKLDTYDNIKLLELLNNIQLDINVRQIIETIINDLGDEEISKHRNVYFIDKKYNALIHIENKSLTRKPFILSITI